MHVSTNHSITLLPLLLTTSHFYHDSSLHGLVNGQHGKQLLAGSTFNEHSKGSRKSELLDTNNQVEMAILKLEGTQCFESATENI